MGSGRDFLSTTGGRTSCPLVGRPRPLRTHPMTTRIAIPSVLLVALVLLLAPAASGQCFTGDDGFDTACCAVPTPTLPAFNAVTVMSEYGALMACHPTFVIPPFPVTFSAPSF